MMKWLSKCGFTSTETVGLLGTGAQDVHLDFHTTPELCLCLMMMMMDDVGLNVLGCRDILGTNCNKLLKLKINGGGGGGGGEGAGVASASVRATMSGRQQGAYSW